MPDWLDALKQSIHSNGHALSQWQVGDATFVLMPFAARLLACEMPGVEGNLFWHHPDMLDPTKAGEQLRGAGGGIAGDRLWIAPEVGYIWPDLAAARVDPYNTACLPAAMDPAEYKIVRDDEGMLSLTTNMELLDHRVSKWAKLRVSRVFSGMDRPGFVSRDLKWSGISIRNTMVAEAGDEGAVAGTWDLLQLPIGGVQIFATQQPQKAAPTSYYEPYREGDVTWDEHAVYFHAKGDHVIKMGLSPEQATGRMVYLRKVAGQTTAILRSFLPCPGMPYVDVPRSSDERFGGDALQAFCDDGRFQSFTEMEYHDPAVIVGKGPQVTGSTCITHVIAGAQKAVVAAASAFLGFELKMAKLGF